MADAAASNKRAPRREGEKVWCPDARNVWVLGTVVEDDGEKLHVVLPETEHEQQFPVSQLHPYDPTHSMDLNNISEMDNLHQAPLLDLLRRRYLEDKIYTYTGDILISINPYKNIPMLYNFPELDSIGKLENPVPHVYSTAHGAYHALCKDGKCQSILVSGESGAGKTEASKYIMRYLANISEIGKRGPKTSEKKAPTSNGSANGGGSSVEQCVLQSNPILEAFGNAKTIRNDNSSRFGKFIKIFYHADGTISGATTSHFLLEKSRIVGCGDAERNYHIFYQLCAGMPAADKATFKLKNASDYYYLNQGNCVQCPEINDKKDFKEMVEAMGTIGIDADLQRSIFTLVATVLHLGNLEFTENAKLEAQIARPDDVTSLAELMQVTPTELEFALTKRTMSAGARGSVAEISLSAVEAVKSRNGLAKDIFSKLFDWLVSQINASTREMTGASSSSSAAMNGGGMMNGGGVAPRFIGILDIFGFESLQVNSFEQLCINYTNEMLQQQFNQHVFVYEQDVYVEEGIDFSRLEFKDNGPCLDLIDKKPLGILCLLDEQAMLGRRASDENFIQKLHQTHVPPPGKGGEEVYYSKPRFASDQFTIHHYAGEVTYSVTGFLEKNDDSLHNDLLSLMHSSKLAFVSKLFPVSADAGGGGGGGAAGNPRKPIRKAGGNKMTGTMTVGRKFREQMADLMLELRATQPSFVRCVKPNNLRFPQGWNASLILNQLIYLGVMETVRIRRSGFPVRRLFSEFYQRYQILTRKAKVSKTARQQMTDRQFCELILSQYLARDNWQLGLKKVFLRDSQLRILDNEARKITHEAATQIQKHVRRRRQQKQYQHIRAKIIQIQSMLRMYKAKLFLQRTRRRVTLLNALARQFVQRKRYLRLRAAAIVVQKRIRGKQARRHVWYLRHAPRAATIITKNVRRYLARKKYLQQRRAASVIANAIKMRKLRRDFLLQRKAASIIAAKYKGRVARRKYKQMQTSAVTLHAVGRGFLARLKYGKKARARAVRRNKAQVQIARVIRGFLARRSYRRSRQRVIMIQARVRANKVRTEYLRGREATINSQAMIRRALVRRRFLREKKMATRIEAFGRMVVYRQRYLTARQRIVTVQSLWRMQLQRRRVRQRVGHITLLQSLWRAHAQRSKFLTTRRRVCLVQAAVRGYLARKHYQKLKQATLVAQAAVRKYLTRRSFLKTRRAIVRLQALTRGVLQRKQYQRARRHVVLLQSLYRQRKAKRTAGVRRRAIARIIGVVRFYVGRLRLRNRLRELFEAAHTFNLTDVLHLAQETPGLLRARDREHDHVSLVHVAAKNGDLNLARFVLEETPQMEDLVYGKDAAGSTPLHYAAKLAHVDMVKLLAKIANRNSGPPGSGLQLFAGGRDRSASSSSSALSDSLDKFRTSSVSLHGSTPSAASPSKLNANMRSMMSSASSAASFSTPAGPAAIPDPSAVKRTTGRRTLVSSSTPLAGGVRRLSAAMPSVLPTSMQVQVYKEGFLRKASGKRVATKRYVMVDETCLSYYKAAKERIPLLLMELSDATLQRISHVDNCFELHSPRLKSSKNSDGVLSFVADSEEEVHAWMDAIRKVHGVRIKTTSPPFQNMICIDTALRREYVNMKNKAGFTPLHLAVQNDDDEGFEAAKVAVWLIENGADANAADVNGDTPLHYAVMLNRFDLVETLMKKGADSAIKNNKGLSALEIAIEDDMKEILDPGFHANTDSMRAPLAKPPTRLADSTYVTVFLGAVAVATGPVMDTPHFNLYVLDLKGVVVERQQQTPNSLIQAGGNYWWFGNTWYLQTPLEHLKDGCVAVMELRHRSLVTEENEVGCWTFFRLDLSKITSGSVTFEMYAPPVDPMSKILARIPGDSFLQADINVSL